MHQDPEPMPCITIYYDLKHDVNCVRLKQPDIMVMKKLHHKVNIIPLIAKADMLTRTELKRMKERVRAL